MSLFPEEQHLIPKNLRIPQGTTLSILNADAPWDTPHPQTIEIVDDGGETVYTTGVLEYTNSSEPSKSKLIGLSPFNTQG